MPVPKLLPVPAPTAAATIALVGERLYVGNSDQVISIDLESGDRVACGEGIAVAEVGGEAWIVERTGVIRRLDADGTERGLLELPVQVRRVATLRGPEPALAAWAEDAVLVRGDEIVPLGAVTGAVVPMRAPELAILRSGRRLVARGMRGDVPLPVSSQLVSTYVLEDGVVLDGDRCALVMRFRDERHLVVVSPGARGILGHPRLDGTGPLAWAEMHEHVLVGCGRELRVIGIADGQVHARHAIDTPIAAIAVDAAGDRIVVVTEVGEALISDYAALVPAAPLRSSAGSPHEREPEVPAPARPPVRSRRVSMHPEELPRDRLVRLRPEPLAPPLAGDDLAAYLDDTRALLVALCRRALAEAAGARSGAEPIDGRPAPAAAAARDAEAAARDRHARWWTRGAPHVELAVELGLSPTAMTILLIAAGPALWGELAPVYGVIADDSGRALCDEHLVTQVLGADVGARRAIAVELDADAPLVRHAVIMFGAGRRPFRDIVVPDVVVRRLTGDDVARDDVAVGLRVHGPAPALDELVAPRDRLAELLRVLATRADEPVRVCVRGRAGCGRRTVLSALAARAERRLGEIEVLPAPADLLADRLRDQLRAAALRGLLPCVSGLRAIGDDAHVRAAIRTVLDRHPGPLAVRAEPDEEPPLAPGFHALDLPVPSADLRSAEWARTLAGHGLDASAARDVGDRFAIGPGVIRRVAAQVAAMPPADLAAGLTAAIRRSRHDRIGRIASRVDELPRWDGVVLPDEVERSVRELIGRVRDRRTVLERWGMAQVAATGRGTTALLQGGPGTGKTLVAGLVARELDYELYRIDLSRVMSKWIGETEKNLGAVFDAAEDGEVVLLFDEADSLFTRRTEVKSSNDRFANLEVNYLLQRLDTFEGVAVLTTNFGAAIDPAFRRRLSMRIEFPMPEAEERRRLWQVHLPPTVPQTADLDLDAIAERYRMSGAYIRNAAMRAAFLAVAENRPVCAELVDRAIELEYQEAGKIEAAGTLQ